MHWIGFIFLFGALFAQDTRLAILSYDAYTIQTEVPLAWIQSSDTASLQIRSSLPLSRRDSDWQQIRLQIRPLAAPYGDLPAENRLGAYLELFAASLPFTSEYPPEHFSEIASFTWGSYPAAMFISYGKPYYAWWVGLELDDTQVLILELGTSLPDGHPPTEQTLAIFENTLQKLSINGQTLPYDPLQRAHERLTDPLGTLAPAAAALRLPGGLEVRLAAPEGWFRRDVTPSAGYPSIYLMEDDLRQVAEGAEPSGAIVQVTLMSENYLAGLFDSQTLPPDLPINYLNIFLPLAKANFSPQNPLEFEWIYPALHLSAEYGNSHHQELILLEVDSNLILLTLYAPQSRWTQLRPLWQNILSSLTINGETLPPEPLSAIYGREEN